MKYLLPVLAICFCFGCKYRPGFHVETSITHYSDRYENTQWFAVEGWIYDGLRAEDIIDMKIFTVVYDSLDAGYRIAHQLESDYKSKGDSIIKTHKK
jgi:hypothetical protein